MVRQRMYALALGHEDLNDHDELRSDPAVDADTDLAGASTPCRFEQRMGRSEAVLLHEVLVERFIASFPSPPRSELGCAGAGRIRLKLLRIGAVVLCNTRRVRLLLSSSCPHQAPPSPG